MWPFGKSALERLRDAIDGYEVLEGLDLDIAVEKKTAVFRGTVPSDAHRNLLVGLAGGINGIERVDATGLAVQGGADLAEDPESFAREVRDLLAKHPKLADDPIEVLQSGSTVILRGAVDSVAEAEAALGLARDVDGVEAVDTAGLKVVQNVRDLVDTNDEGNVVYTVASGDTLSHIAQRFYGNGTRSFYMKIADANGLDDPDKIRVGQKLVIPGTPEGPESRLVS